MSGAVLPQHAVTAWTRKTIFTLTSLSPCQLTLLVVISFATLWFVDWSMNVSGVIFLSWFYEEVLKRFLDLYVYLLCR